VVERRLERAVVAGRGTAPGGRAAAAAAPALGLLLRLVLVLGLGLRLRGLLRLGGVELGGDERVVLRAQVDLVVEVRAGGSLAVLALGLQVLLALERLDLLHRHLQLVGDPRVGPPLADPTADLVQVRAQ
jgi:hypothetical protein